MEGAGTAPLYPAVGWGRTSQVPANSRSGRDLGWGESKGLGEAHALPPDSPGQGPKCAGRAWSAPRRLWAARSKAHGAVCPFTAPSLACLCFGATGQQYENLSRPWLPLPPDFGLSYFLFHRSGGRRAVRAGYRCYHSWPHSPVALHRASSLGSGAKPLGQSLSRSCQYKRNVCRAGGRREAPPPPLKLDRSLSQK